ncbi:hypothetical protein [Bacillus muralis]|uniref:hypothetical protein n=1 Tax=Peribacillus muralis TaxID=264697 RepID=UPI0007D7FF8D
MKNILNTLVVSAGIALIIYPMISLAYMTTNLFREKYGELLFGTILLVETKNGVNMEFTNDFFFSMLIVLVVSFIIFFPIIKIMETKKKNKIETIK